MADEKEPKVRTRTGPSDKSEQNEQEKSAAEKRKAEAEARAAAKAKEAEELKAKRELEKKERDEKRAAEKAERDKKREEEKAKKEQEREEAKLEKEREKAAKRQAQIDSGEIIFATYERELLSAEDAGNEDNGVVVTYTASTPKKEEVANRAREVIRDLMEGATEVPMSGKDLADEYGGGTVQWVAFFGMLRILGYIKPYRFKTGERGESGLSYLWVGPTDLDLSVADEIAEAVEA